MDDVSLHSCRNGGSVCIRNDVRAFPSESPYAYKVSCVAHGVFPSSADSDGD